MPNEDERFAEQVLDAGQRAAAVKRWRRSRALSLVAAALFFLGAMAWLLVRQTGLCGLFAAVAAINYAVAAATDVKIKLATLAGRQGKA